MSDALQCVLVLRMWELKLTQTGTALFILLIPHWSQTHTYSTHDTPLHRCTAHSDIQLLDGKETVINLQLPLFLLTPQHTDRPWRGGGGNTRGRLTSHDLLLLPRVEQRMT